MEKIACERIDSASEELNAISQDLWSNPELAFEEHHAHDLLTAFLEKEGFEVQRQYILKTGFRASFGNDDGPQIAIMAEYDALPEIGHACGHNLIAESSVGAALGIKAALESMEKPRGRVVVLGTPAEEGGCGKGLMMDGGAVDKIDVALMVHPYKHSIAEPFKLAFKKVAYTFHGKAAHAAMSPWMGNNALDAAVQCYNSISAKRQQFKPTVRVHGVFTNGGDRPNIIPEEAELLYYIRAPTTAELEPVVKKCEACAKGAALASDCTVDIKYQGYYAEVITNRNLAQLYRKHCEDMGVEFSNDPAIAKSLGGSTDMGNVSFVVPSIHPMFAINTDAPNHSRDFTKAAGAPDAQKPTLIQAKALALTAIQLLQPGGDKLMKSIKAEFKEISPNPMINSSYSFTNC